MPDSGAIKVEGKQAAVVAFERCLEINPQFADAENVRRELEAAQGLAGSNSG